MRKKNITLISVFMVDLFILFSCSRMEKQLKPALESIKAEDLAKHIEILASDEFEGRAPSTPGEEKTIQYLKNEFEALELQPGNGDNYFQEFPIVRIVADQNMELKVSSKKKQLQLKNMDEFLATTPLPEKQVSIKNSEIVYVGYGIVAPEYNWNDYEGLDVKGKTVMMHVNDPGYATKDATLFNGSAMTYYGRWTFKYEEAARQGAAAAIVIHETEAAGYPFSVLQNSRTGPRFYIDAKDQKEPPCKIQAWITSEAAKKVFAAAGVDFAEQKRAAATPGFKAVDLQLKATLTLLNQIQLAKTNNVIAVLPGSERADEYVIYTAHWDHHGIKPNLEGDNIYNGAVDNATGTSALLELAEAFTRLTQRPKRSIVFLSVSCEEQGLLGSQYYAKHPIYPPAKTVAVINMDALNILGKMRDITVIGYGYSELDGYVLTAAKSQNRTVNPDPQPEKGYYYRSDHFSFAKEGIPAVYISRGVDHVEKGKEWVLEQRDKWTKENYHKPSDEYDPDTWNFDGMVHDVRLFFRTGFLLAMDSKFPNWQEGTEFIAKRDAMMQ
ncbi:MAG: M28 family metallopeptidase [Candidatus Heimdallarchaeota archaeon]